MKRIVATASMLLIFGMVVSATDHVEAPGTEDDRGRALYTNCAACHGVSGEGEFGPPLASNPGLADADHVISYLLTGSVRMPPFAEQLTDAEIAAVTNFIRNSWGNRAGTVTAADVAMVEASLKKGN